MKKTGFDETKDAKIAQHEIETGLNEKIVASVHRYDGGESKLQLIRMYQDKNAAWQPAKLGRLNKADLKKLNELLALVQEHFE